MSRFAVTVAAVPALIAVGSWHVTAAPAAPGPSGGSEPPKPANPLTGGGP
jgi:hypothetical protein